MQSSASQHYRRFRNIVIGLITFEGEICCPFQKRMEQGEGCTALSPRWYTADWQMLAPLEKVFADTDEDTSG